MMSMPAQASREMRFDGIHCTLTVQKFPSEVVLLKISGTDIGEFGSAPMLELKQCLTGVDPIRLFIDARDVRGASIDVSGEWAGWLLAHTRAVWPSFLHDLILPQLVESCNSESGDAFFDTYKRIAFRGCRTVSSFGESGQTPFQKTPFV